RTRHAVPCDTAADHADAHQLRDLAGSTLLARAPPVQGGFVAMGRPSDYIPMEYRSDTTTMFEPTIPFGEPELMRVSAFQRYLDDLAGVGGGPASRPGALSPSLMADLKRVEESGR